jgi:hypothetical protein
MWPYPGAYNIEEDEQNEKLTTEISSQRTNGLHNHHLKVVQSWRWLRIAKLHTDKSNINS